MASIGLLSALGGALSGIGQGMVKQEEQAQKRGLEMREARRRELEEQSRREFQTTERVAGQEFTAGRDEAARQAQAALSMENRLSTAELQQQRLDAEAEQKRLDREAQANDPLRKAQADYYMGGGAAGQNLVPVQMPDPDNPGQTITLYKPVKDAVDQQVGTAPGRGKAGPTDYQMYEAARKEFYSNPDNDLKSADVAEQEITKGYEQRKLFASRMSGAAAPPQGAGATAPANGPANAAGAVSPPPGYPNARRAPNGNWYVPDPNNPGKYFKVD